MIKMGGIVMKKMFLTLALLMSLNVFAQRNDEFFHADEYMYGNRISNPNEVLYLPTLGIGSINNEPAPLGNGLLIISTLGILYTARKSKNRKKRD